MPIVHPNQINPSPRRCLTNFKATIPTGIRAMRLQTTTTATTLAAGRVGRSGGDILNTADLHARTGQRAKSGLGTGAGGLGAVTAGSADLDVKGGDTDLLAAGSDVLSSQHGGVGGGLVTIGLDLHATGDTADGLAATGITQNVSLWNQVSSSTSIWRVAQEAWIR